MNMDDIDQRVFGVIHENPNGIYILDIVKKLELPTIKVWDTIQDLKKQGRIITYHKDKILR